MTTGPQEVPSRRGARVGRGGRVAAELEPLLDGPVHPPSTVDAALELVADPTVRSLPRLLAVVGATGTDDVAAAVGWAAEHGVGVLALDPRRRPRTDRSAGLVPTTGAGPVLVLSLVRADRVDADPATHTLRVGPGASWAAVHRAASAAGCGPRAVLRRPGTVAHGVGALTRRGVTLVTGDGTVHRLSATSGEEDLWWAHRAGVDLGVVTEVVLDPRDTTTYTPRPRRSDEDRARLAALRRRHDPRGILTRSAGESG